MRQITSPEYPPPGPTCPAGCDGRAETMALGPKNWAGVGEVFPFPWFDTKLRPARFFVSAVVPEARLIVRDRSQRGMRHGNAATGGLRMLRWKQW